MTLTMASAMVVALALALTRELQLEVKALRSLWLQNSLRVCVCTDMHTYICIFT